MRLGVPILQGKRIKLSPQRRFIVDLMHHAQAVPSVPMQRRMNLAPLIAARRAANQRICWTAIFSKAYALLARDLPELRRAFMPWPWAHLYEHPESVVSFSVEKVYRGETGVFFGQISAPDRRSLTELNDIVGHYRTATVEDIVRCRHAMRVSAWPGLLRRMLWFAGLALHGGLRAHVFGTFGFSVVAGLGASGLHLLSPLSTTLDYAPFAPDGSIDVRVAFDHRVVDGAFMARALVALEQILNHVIAQELRELDTSTVNAQ